MKMTTHYPDGARKLATSMSYRSLLTKSVYVPIVIGTMVLGGLFGAFGIVLVYLGAKGNSHIQLFGQSLETADVGVASIFIGAVTVILVLRALLRNAELALNSGTTAEPLETGRDE
jgi:hypothetical protein